MDENESKDLVSEQCDDLLFHAYTSDASDIHFIPREEDTLIELRIHGYLYQMAILEKEQSERMINHFKFTSGMDIGEVRLPQSGALPVLLEENKVALRFSTLPTPSGESLVIRLLPQEKTTTINDLSVFEESVHGLSGLLRYENGLILVSGPTGSGKTTTLYTLLAALQKKYHSRVITIEDPIEKRNTSFIQMEVNERADFTYANGFKALLRHDPDIIMIGEIRDEETAKIALKAALSGHLVLSTVHASHAVTAIQRMDELGISRFDLREVLVGIVGQRLATIQCPICGAVCKPGCPNRNHPKRTGIFEILAGMPLHELLASQTYRPLRSNYKTIEEYIEEGISRGWIADNERAREVLHHDWQKKLD
ncbi:MAG: competence type IV pilus ATPase ComGA [Sporolactobacillus sp.]